MARLAGDRGGSLWGEALLSSDTKKKKRHSEGDCGSGLPTMIQRRRLRLLAASAHKHRLITPAAAACLFPATKLGQSAALLH